MATARGGVDWTIAGAPARHLGAGTARMVPVVPLSRHSSHCDLAPVLSVGLFTWPSFACQESAVSKGIYRAPEFGGWPQGRKQLVDDGMTERIMDVTPEQRQRRRAAYSRYRKSAKGREKARRYRQSEKGRAAKRRYDQSAKGRAAQRRYNKSAKGRAAQRCYDQSPKGVQRDLRHKQSKANRSLGEHASFVLRLSPSGSQPRASPRRPPA